MTIKERISGWVRRFRLLQWSIRLAVRIMVPQHYVGAVGVVFNEAGQVLLVEHVFRPYYPWGLPGGWVERYENPAETVRRELKEELNVDVTVKKLLLCQPQGNLPGSCNAPPGLGLAYYCRLVDEVSELDNLAQVKKTYEVLSIQWLAPEKINYKLAPLQREAIILAKQEFDREGAKKSAERSTARRPRPQGGSC